MKSTNSSPTIAEIRQLGQKPEYRTQGNWLARRWARPAAVYGTWIAIRLGMTANMVTVMAALAWLAEAFAFASGTVSGIKLGCFLGFLGFWLDHVDGQVARVTRTSSLEGVFLDFWMHSAHCLTRAFGLGWGAYLATDNKIMIIAGMLTAFGWIMLSQANDTKYKAMFAKLKNERGNWTVHNSENQSRVSYERQGLTKIKRFVSIALLRLHEPHSVLMVLGLISVVSFPSSLLALEFLKVMIVFWATTSPLLAIARLWKMIKISAVQREFDLYFQKSSE